MRSYWIQVGTKSNVTCALKGREDAETHTEGPVGREEEAGVMQPQKGRASDGQQPSGAGTGEETFFLPAWERSAALLTPGFETSGLQFIEMGFHHVGQSGFELLASSDPPALTSQSVGITGVSHYDWPRLRILNHGDMKTTAGAGLSISLYVNIPYLPLPFEDMEPIPIPLEIKVTLAILQGKFQLKKPRERKLLALRPSATYGNAGTSIQTSCFIVDNHACVIGVLEMWSLNRQHQISWEHIRNEKYQAPSRPTESEALQAKRQSFTMLARMSLCLDLVIRPPWPPKVLELQMLATMPVTKCSTCLEVFMVSASCLWYRGPQIHVTSPGAPQRSLAEALTIPSKTKPCCPGPATVTSLQLSSRHNLQIIFLVIQAFTIIRIIVRGTEEPDTSVHMRATIYSESLANHSTSLCLSFLTCKRKNTTVAKSLSSCAVDGLLYESWKGLLLEQAHRPAGGAAFLTCCPEANQSLGNTSFNDCRSIF
ncbi:Protein GVQW1 [Plecturocebus cupreus]